jgi:hypothetical protein
MDGSTVDLPVYLDLMYWRRDCKHIVQDTLQISETCEFSKWERRFWFKQGSGDGF